jgi:hypothetical protein
MERSMIAFTQALLSGNPYRGRLFGIDVDLAGYSSKREKITHFFLELFTQVKTHNLVHELGHVIFIKSQVPTSQIALTFSVERMPGLRIHSEFDRLPSLGLQTIHALTGPIASVLFARTKLVLLKIFESSIPAPLSFTMATGSYAIIGIELYNALYGAYKKNSTDFGFIARENTQCLAASLTFFSLLCLNSLSENVS